MLSFRVITIESSLDSETVLFFAFPLIKSFTEMSLELDILRSLALLETFKDSSLESDDLRLGSDILLDLLDILISSALEPEDFRDLGPLLLVLLEIVMVSSEDTESFLCLSEVEGSSVAVSFSGSSLTVLEISAPSDVSLLGIEISLLSPATFVSLIPESNTATVPEVSSPSDCTVSSSSNI